MLTLNKLQIDCTKTISEIKNFIKFYVRESKTNGAIISASGGIDSTVLLFLSIEALGNENIIALMIPERDITNPRDIKDVKEISKNLGVTCDIVEITPHLDLFHDRIHIFEKLDKVSIGNIKARFRMMIAYTYANHFKKLVIGSTNKTEWLTGYFTKYGDGAVDLMPIADLYKTQIRQLARKLKIPLKIIDKRPSAGLWPQQYDEEELGINYEKLYRKSIFDFSHGGKCHSHFEMGVVFNHCHKIQIQISLNWEKIKIPIRKTFCEFNFSFTSNIIEDDIISIL